MVDIFQIVKYEGENTIFRGKSPLEDFYPITQLTVYEAQETIFFMNGQILDLFGSGCHTLKTQNISLLVGKFLNKSASDQPPLHSEAYYVNKTDKMLIKWETEREIHGLCCYYCGDDVYFRNSLKDKSKIYRYAK